MEALRDAEGESSSTSGLDWRRPSSKVLVVDWVMRLAPAPSDSTPPFGWSPGGLLGHLEGLAGHLEELAGHLEARKCGPRIVQNESAAH